VCACVHTFPYDALTKRIQIEIYKFNGIWGADCAPLFALQHNTTHREMRKKLFFVYTKLKTSMTVYMCLFMVCLVNNKYNNNVFGFKTQIYLYENFVCVKV